MEYLERIDGMNDVIQSLPQEYRHWHLFGNILKLEYEKSFDYEKLRDICNINLLVADNAEQYRINIFLRNVRGELSFMVGDKISGFAIKDMKMDGYENDSGFRIYDFEDGELSLYCENIEVRLLK